MPSLLRWSTLRLLFAPACCGPEPTDRLQYLTSCLPKYISQYSVYKDELVLYCAPEDVLHVLRFLKDHSQCLYRALMDVTAVDYPTRCVCAALWLRRPGLQEPVWESCS